VFFAVSFALSVSHPAPVPHEGKLLITENIVNHINSLATTWRASTDQGKMSGITLKQAKALCGAKKGGPVLERKIYDNKVTVPDSFDSRTQWPNCPSISQIRDQSACGSCWAFGAVEAMSDRYCIVKGTNLPISSEDMVACCDSCGYGCDGGFPSAAWAYWQSTGLVTEKCSPYTLPSCDHHLPNSTHPCPSQEYPTPPCVESCTDGETWENTLTYGTSINSASGEADIKQEIFTNGPVEVTFDVYEDFLPYKSGVYQHETGGYLGGHAVKMLGWGVESGVNYWLIANSWNPDWGDNGYFKILRGTDECGIEDEADFGEPK